MTTPTEPAPSPAGLLSDDALRELFEKDPLDLTRADFARMVDWARAGRARWGQEQAEARSSGRKPRSKVSALPKGQVQLPGVNAEEADPL
jgi:hypothetical protein